MFTRPETVPVWLDSWPFLQDEDRLTLLDYVVLENPIHFIVSAENMPKQIGDFKSDTARRMSDHLGEYPVRTLLEGLEYHKARPKSDRPFPLWQERSLPRVIESEVGLRQKWESIPQNPV